jgi:hypothetical protein
MYLADLERQLMDMSFLLRRRPGGEEGGPSGETAGPVRDELSPVGHRNDFLSMPSGRSGGRSGISDDLLLPPPILSSGARSESYDPEKDPFLFDDGFISASGRDAYGRNPAGSGLSGAEPRMPAARRREGGR